MQFVSHPCSMRSINKVISVVCFITIIIAERVSFYNAYDLKPVQGLTYVPGKNNIVFQPAKMIVYLIAFIH